MKKLYFKNKTSNSDNTLIDKEKAFITEGLSSLASPLGESYNFDAMIKLDSIRKLKV